MQRRICHQHRSIVLPSEKPTVNPENSVCLFGFFLTASGHRCQRLILFENRRSRFWQRHFHVFDLHGFYSTIGKSTRRVQACRIIGSIRARFRHSCMSRLCRYRDCKYSNAQVRRTSKLLTSGEALTSSNLPSIAVTTSAQETTAPMTPSGLQDSDAPSFQPSTPAFNSKVVFKAVPEQLASTLSLQ